MCSTVIDSPMTIFLAGMVIMALLILIFQQPRYPR
jgi:hypothetical protein